MGNWVPGGRLEAGESVAEEAAAWFNERRRVAPQLMAGLRNLTTGLIHASSHTTISPTAALR